MKGFDFTKTYQDLIEIIERDGGPEGFLLPAVDDYRSGTQYRTCLEAQEYWKNRNPTIEKYRRLLYTVTGSAVPDNYSADYKLASNVYFRFVTQTVQYLLGRGVRFENPETAKRLGEDFDFKLQTALTYAINGGAAYGLMNYDRLEVFGADEFVPIYDEETGALRAGIRFWQLSDEKPMRLTLYTEDGYTEYICRDGELSVMSPKRPYKQSVGVIDGLEPIITDGGNYSCFPIVPLFFSARTVFNSRLPQTDRLPRPYRIRLRQRYRRRFADILDDFQRRRHGRYRPCKVYPPYAHGASGCCRRRRSKGGGAHR